MKIAELLEKLKATTDKHLENVQTFVLEDYAESYKDGYCCRNAEIQLRDDVILKLAQFAEAVEYDSMGMSGKAKECLTECEALLGGEK